MATGEQMRFRLPGWIILVLSGVCFANAFHLGSGVWGNPLADAWDGAMNSVVLGIIFFLHGLNTGPRRADVVVAACLIAGLGVADGRGSLSNQYNPIWIVLLVLSFIVYIRGAWIERRRK
jgi:hypothetical protein